MSVLGAHRDSSLAPGELSVLWVSGRIVHTHRQATVTEMGSGSSKVRCRLWSEDLEQMEPLGHGQHLPVSESQFPHSCSLRSLSGLSL